MNSTKNPKASALIIIGVIAAFAAAYLAYGTFKSTQTPNSPSNTAPVESSARGTLRGHIYCTEKVGDSPCSSSIEITASTGTVRVVQSNNEGSYSIDLPAGKHTVKPQPKIGYPVIVPVTNPVTVKANQTTTLDIRYMDGTK